MKGPYSEAFKARMVERLAGPNGVSATALSAEVGVSQSALSKWLRDAGSLEGMGKHKKPVDVVKGLESPRRRPEDWSAEEKLKAVIEVAGLDETALGEWLRRNGVHEAQLRDWRRAAVEALAGKKPSSSQPKRIRELEREVRRKDRALAETAALLVLRKKVDALWGDEDASTGLKNDDESST